MKYVSLLLFLTIIPAASALPFSFETLTREYRSFLTGYVTFLRGPSSFLGEDETPERTKELLDTYITLLETYASVTKDLEKLAKEGGPQQEIYRNLQFRVTTITAEMVQRLTAFQNGALEEMDFKKEVAALVKRCTILNQDLVEFLKK